MLYFIANTSLSEHISVKADFQVESEAYPWVWNPETGDRFTYPTSGTKNRLELEIPRATSMLIVFDKHSKKGQPYPVRLKPGGKKITGPWQLQLHHINGNKQVRNLEALIDLVNDTEMKNFAGTVVYEKTLSIDNNDYQYIDLGNVQGVTELTLNGKPLGVKWYGTHIYYIKDTIKTGENKLSARLTTISGNYLKSLKDNPVAQRWTKKQPFYSMGIIGPARLV